MIGFAFIPRLKTLEDSLRGLSRSQDRKKFNLNFVYRHPATLDVIDTIAGTLPSGVWFRKDE